MSNTQRVAVNATPAVVSRLDKLKKAMSAASYSEVIRRSLTVMDLFTEVVQEGGVIHVITPGKGQRRVLLPVD
jgi:hypothetical protein